MIVVGRARRPVLETVRAVMGIRGEPSAPPVPAEGLVWRAIVDQVAPRDLANDAVMRKYLAI